jgi:hypothetical protein
MILHGLENLKGLPALLTFVFVSRHLAARHYREFTDLCNPVPAVLTFFQSLLFFYGA